MVTTNLIPVKCKEDNNQLVLFGCFKIEGINADSIVIKIDIETLKQLNPENGIIDLTIQSEKV